MKVTRDHLVALGKLLSTSEGQAVDSVDVAGETVQAKDARDAFEEAQKTGAAAPGKIAHTIETLQEKAESAKQKLMQNAVTRWLVQHMDPVENVIEHETVKLHFHDGSEKETDLALVDTAFNRTLHNLGVGNGLVGFIPWVGMIGYAGTVIGTAIAAGAQKLAGNDDKARALWDTAETNVFRLVGGAIPLAGSLVDAMIVADESKARSALHAATVGDLKPATA